HLHHRHLPGLVWPLQPERRLPTGVAAGGAGVHRPGPGAALPARPALYRRRPRRSGAADRPRPRGALARGPVVRAGVRRGSGGTPGAIAGLGLAETGGSRRPLPWYSLPLAISRLLRPAPLGAECPHPALRDVR